MAMTLTRIWTISGLIQERLLLYVFFDGTASLLKFTNGTMQYNLEVTEMTLSPDGYARQMTVFNGQFPGPTIYADWGDTIQVTVKNSLNDNGTSIHWHGIRQLKSNQMDGTNGITECPIAPGASKTYTFKATQHGSSWYHSHHSVQYSNGLVGGIVINGPATANYDIDLGVYHLTDWLHEPAFAEYDIASHAPQPPTADSVLVNGSSNAFNAGKALSTVTLEPGKSHRLRLINSGINNWQHVGLDGHTLTVISADFTPVVPYQTQSVSLAVGELLNFLNFLSLANSRQVNVLM